MAFSRDTLTETPCDTVLRLIPVGTGKHGISFISFYKIDHVMKCCIIGPPIMRYYDDGKLFPELRYPFLHLLSGYRIES